MSLGAFSKISVILLVNLCVIDTQTHTSFYNIPGVKDEVYSEPGDINLGDMVTTSHWHNQQCQDSLILSSVIPEATESIKFAVDLINKDPHLLPNVTFGFHIRASCGSIAMKLATSIAFVPRSERICKDGVCYSKNTKASDPQWMTHDVLGLLSPENSAEAHHVSSLFSVARLPILGYNSGSNELCRRFNFPFYLRINAHEWYQSFAMLRFAHDMGWKYLTIVYTDDDYGRDAFMFIHMYAFEYGVSIAASHRLDNYTKVASDIVKNPKARAIVVYLTPWRFKTLLQKVIDRNSTRHFIWIGSNIMNGYNGYTYTGVEDDPAIGAFIVFPSAKFIPSYYDHIRNLDIKRTNNPWLKPIWEHFLNCSYDAGTCDPNADILKTRGYRPYKSAALKIDAVLTFAHAAHDMIQDRCPGAQGKEARDCIDGELFLAYMKKVRFHGLNQLVFFNPEWDETEANFTISQLTYNKTVDPFGWGVDKRIYERPVALYDSYTDKLVHLDLEMTWSHLDPVERIVPWTNDSLPIEIPESICSRPCVVGEYKVIQDNPICWLCLTCVQNERIVKGDNPCEACPLLLWPDPESNYTTCIDIPPTYQTIEDTIPIIFISLAAVALTVATVILLLYTVIYRNDPGIKSSSRELSVIQFLAILVGYTTIILFQTTPTDVMCLSIFYLFCMSFAMLYSPLVIKTTGIFRMVKRDLESESKVTVNRRVQLPFTVCLIIIQFVLCGATFVLYLPGAKRYQPIRSEKLVELSCDFTLFGLGSFLGYNITLIFVSAVTTLMVRGLADSFKELKFISMCVSTTLLIWLAFLPTYFTATREYIRGALLCMALLLNHSVALVILFVPKIYAAIVPPSGDIAKH